MSRVFLHVRRTVALAAFLFLALSAPHARAQAPEKKDIKVMMDWIIQGTHAPFFVAQSKGYYKDGGLNVQIDAGKGATNVAVSVAGGVYDFGWVDMPSMIKFNAQNPSSPLIAVYISFDDSPLAFITLKSKNIRKPADLNGARIAAVADDRTRCSDGRGDGPRDSHVGPARLGSRPGAPDGILAEAQAPGQVARGSSDRGATATGCPLESLACHRSCIGRGP